MAKNSNDEILLPVQIEISNTEAEEVLIALALRIKLIPSTEDYNDELGDRLGRVFEQVFGADPGWWQRVRG